MDTIDGRAQDSRFFSPLATQPGRLRAKVAFSTWSRAVSDFMQQVMDQFDPNQVGRIAAQLGVAPDQAEQAIRQAVPLLVGGLAGNARSDSGAMALHRALGDHAGFDLGSVLGSVLGGGGDGGAILGHVFGDRLGRAEQGLGRSSGLGTQGAGQLLAMLAPIILGMLGKRTREQSLDAGGLGGMLGRELQNFGLGGGNAGGGDLLTSMLDQDGDGQLGLGDLLKVGAGMFGNRRS